MTITILEDEQNKFREPISSSRPLILYTLFPHESKVSVMHYKIRRNDENDSVLPSGRVMEFQAGFRRVPLRPMFASVYQKTDKLKFNRFLHKDADMQASCFA